MSMFIFRYKPQISTVQVCFNYTLKKTDVWDLAINIVFKLYFYS